MKEPIEVGDIRKGDLIRWESANRAGTATEWVATIDRDNDGWSVAGTFYLLERHKPAVELPLEDHHFGWLTAPGTSLARDRVAGEWFFGGVAIKCSGIDGINRQKVTAWEPGTLVPTSALCDLRKQRHTWELGIVLNNDQLAIRHFLADVDASKP